MLKGALTEMEVSELIQACNVVLSRKGHDEDALRLRGLDKPYKILYPFDKNKIYLKYLVQENILELLIEFYGTLENVIPVWQDIMIKQPTNQSVEVVPHQDADPKVNTIPDDILTFGLYLHDSSESLVCFLPKSHRLGVLTRDELNHYIETRMERFVSLTAEAGDISIHHATTIHYSKKNQTKHPRYTFYLTFRDIENLTQEKIWEKQWILSRQALFVYALKEYAPHYLKKYFSDNKYEQLQPYLDTLNFRLVHDTPKIKYKFESVFIK